MTEHTSDKDQLHELRRLAEERKRDHPPQAMSELEVQQIMHELQVHQIELEMQNEELRVTQEQLGESLEKYTDLFEFAPVGYVTLDPKGRIVEANLTFARQLGTERGRLINSSLAFSVIEPDRPAFWAHLDQVFQRPERQICELQLEQPNAPNLYVQFNSVRSQAADGRSLCRTSITDISAQMAVKEELISLQSVLEQRVATRTFELSESEKKFKKLSKEFQTLLYAISDTLILLSPKKEILWMNSNKTLERQRTSSDVAEQYCYKLLHGHTPFAIDSPITRCFHSAKNEVSVITHNGAVLDIRAFPILEADSVSSVLLLVSDITEKITMQAEAIQAGHLASLGELAAGVAHEINNPITGIINYGQILLNECDPQSMEQDIGARIVKEGERVGRIVKTLLSFAQQDRRQKKRRTSIPDVLAESIVLTQAQIRKEGIDLRICLDDDLPRIEANFHQIQQVFINIINNARYALNEKYAERHENKRIKITGKAVMIRDRPFVRIIFHDQGVGIDKDQLPMLTKPFFSTKPFGKGTGLGLNITKKIIADHDGRLVFESVKGDFTRVIIELPVHQTKTEAAA
ncbi:MAG: histidine kinase dimerization/phospho-acceptor domain-containing protein [Desulfobulbus sp.]|nr:histidine kinase dimerization/phospho-acceptor domain-containing protein [Desulfobulbus sp.]